MIPGWFCEVIISTYQLYYPIFVGRNFMTKICAFRLSGSQKFKIMKVQKWSQKRSTTFIQGVISHFRYFRNIHSDFLARSCKKTNISLEIWKKNMISNFKFKICRGGYQCTIQKKWAWGWGVGGIGFFVFDIFW